MRRRRLWVAVGVSLVTLLQLAALVRGAVLAETPDAALTFTTTGWLVMLLVLVTAVVWGWALRENRADRWRTEHRPGAPPPQAGPDEPGPNRALSGEDQPPSRW